MSAVSTVIGQSMPVSALAEQKPSLMAKFASRYSVEPSKMMSTLKNTAFKQKDGEVSNEQLMALLVVADQYGLNPFTKEIYAFPDKGGIVPVVGVDGWLRIINSHAQFDGLEFLDGPADKFGQPEWIECTIYRKDRSHPTRTREYMSECKRGTQPWQSHPRRMLRHKSTIQCARLAFGFAGIYDLDEAERIAERDITPVAAPAAVAALNAQIAPPFEPEPSAEIEEAVVFAAPDVVMSYANVATRIERAENAEALGEAMDLIRNVPSPDQQAELNALASKRLTQIQQ